MDRDRVQHEGDPKRVVRAAQYVRMSTEHQKYSTENQAEAIAAYAARRGFEIIRTYEDAGKSGLRMDGRAGLQKLIADVRNGLTDFNAILVYDVMYLKGWPINGVFAFVTMGGAVVLLFVCREWAPLTGHAWEAVIIAMTLTASAIASGVVAGQTARHMSYDLASRDAPHCGASVVLRRFGERYVAVLPNSQKIVTDLSCKAILVIPPHRKLKDIRFHWRPFPYVQIVPVKEAVV